MTRFAGGRDGGRTPSADPRAERAARIKAQRSNLGKGVGYDKYGRLEGDVDLAARVAALEASASTVAPSASAVVEKSFAASYVGGGGSGSDPVAQSPTGGVYNTKTITADYTVGLTDQVIWVDATAAAVTVTLPNALKSRGRWVFVKKVDSGGNAVTLVDANGNDVEFASSVALSTQGDCALVIAGSVGSTPQWGII